MIYVRFYLVFFFALIIAMTSHNAMAGFDRMIVFGDSLSDTGNVKPVDQDKRWSGRFTNGPIYIDHLKSSLNMSNEQVLNYAFGGALTGPHASFGALLKSPVPMLTQQIGLFTNEHDPKSTDLILLYAGANDYLSLFQNPRFYQLMATSKSPEAIQDFASKFRSHVTESVQNISQGMETLLNAGADSLLIANLPDFSKTPIIKRISELFPNLTQKEVDNLKRIMRQFSVSHNQALSASVATLRENLGPEQGIEIVDIFSSIEAMLADPEHYGFSNTTDALNRQDGKIDGAWFYADDVHPSAAVHYYLSQKAFEEAKKLSKNDTFLPLMDQLEAQTKSLVLSPIQQKRLSRSLDGKGLRRQSPSVTQKSIYAQLNQNDSTQNTLLISAQSTALEKPLTFQEREKHKGSKSSEAHRLHLNYQLNQIFSIGAFTHIADSNLSSSTSLSHREMGISGSIDYLSKAKTMHYLDWGLSLGRQSYGKDSNSHRGQSQNIFVEMGSLMTNGHFLYGPLVEFSSHHHDRLNSGSCSSLTEKNQSYKKEAYSLGGQFFLPSQKTHLGFLSHHLKLGLTHSTAESQHAYQFDRSRASFKNQSQNQFVNMHYEADLAFEKIGGLFFNLDFSDNKAHSREKQIQVHYALEF
jgi:thermolabile hemolysin